MKRSSTHIQSGSTLFLKFVIFLIGIIVLALCIFVLPLGISSDRTGYYRPILIGMYISAIPFFIALFQAMKLLHFIDKNNVFSLFSIRALKTITYCAIAICAFYSGSMPYIFTVAQIDDAPGVVLIGCIIIFGSLMVATAAAMFQQQLQKVIDIKEENELTV